MGWGLIGGSRRVGLELSGTFFFLLLFFFLYLLAVRLRLGIDNVVEQPPRTISRTNRIRDAHRVSASNGQGREGERNRDDE